MVQYTKQPLDFACQLQLLKGRGLIVDDEGLAMRQLHSISYFRLADYLRPMEIDATSHKFGSGCHFSEAIAQYIFDRELRTLVFKAIQDVEIALRTRINHYFSMRHGAFWFMDASLFKNRDIFDNTYETIRKELARSKEEFIKEHYNKYDIPTMPPSWKTLEVVSFGTLCLCSPRSNMEQTFSYDTCHSSTIIGTMDKQLSFPTNETLCTTMLPCLYGKQHSPQWEFCKGGETVIAI